MEDRLVRIEKALETNLKRVDLIEKYKTEIASKEHEIEELSTQIAEFNKPDSKLNQLEKMRSEAEVAARGGIIQKGNPKLLLVWELEHKEEYEKEFMKRKELLSFRSAQEHQVLEFKSRIGLLTYWVANFTDTSIGRSNNWN